MSQDTTRNTVGCTIEEHKMLYRKNIPNKKTKKVFAETDAGKNLTKCKNIDDLIEKLDITF